MKGSTRYRLTVALTAGTVLLLVLGAGALGIIGVGGPANRVFLAVPVVLVVGAALARLRPREMATALLATAATQILAPAVAFSTDLEGTEGAWVLDVMGLTAMFAGAFAVAAWLFRGADEASAASARGRAA